MAGEGMKVFLEIDDMLTEVLTVKLAAYRYNFSVRTIRQWIDEGKVSAIDLDGRWLIPVPEIDRLARRDNRVQIVAE